MNSETAFNWSNKQKGKFVSKCLLIYSIKNVALGNLRRSVHWQPRNDPSAHLIWGSLSNNDGAGDGDGDGDGDENVTGKVNSHYFKLYRAYSTSFNSSNVGKFCRSWIPNDCIAFQEKKKKVHPIDNTLLVQNQISTRLIRLRVHNKKKRKLERRRAHYRKLIMAL